MVETLSTLSIISFAVAALCFVLAVFFWFFFNIPSVIGDLTGRTARKSIAQIRAANEKASAKSKTVPDRPGGVATEKLKKKNVSKGNAAATTLLTETVSSAPATSVLGEDQTQLLADNATALLVDNATTLLVDDNETSRLSATPSTCPGGVALEMIESIMLIHTNETIGN